MRKAEKMNIADLEALAEAGDVEAQKTTSLKMSQMSPKLNMMVMIITRTQKIRTFKCSEENKLKQGREKNFDKRT